MSDFTGTVLRTPRLTLSLLDDSDAGALLSIYSDTETMRYWSGAAWTALEQATQQIAQSRRDARDGSALRLGIKLAETGELIGTATLYAFHRSNRRCEIGYILGRSHWGRGLMSEALAALLEHGFDVLDLHRVEADIDPRNEGSRRILQRLHFTREGLMRERWIVNGELCDTEYYGMLRADWRAARATASSDTKAANHDPRSGTS